MDNLIDQDSKNNLDQVTRDQVHLLIGTIQGPIGNMMIWPKKPPTDMTSKGSDENYVSPIHKVIQSDSKIQSLLWNILHGNLSCKGPHGNQEAISKSLESAWTKLGNSSSCQLVQGYES